MAEFWRALRTLKARQAEPAQPVAHAPGAALALAAPASRPAARATLAPRATPDEPERGAARRLQHDLAAPGAPGRTLHEQAAPWLPNEPEAGSARHAPAARTKPQPQPLVGQTVAGDRALATAAALLQGMPDGPC